MKRFDEFAPPSMPAGAGTAPLRHVGANGPTADVKQLSGRALAWWRAVVLLVVVVPFVGGAAAVWHLWGRGLTAFDAALFLALYLVTGFGITVGYHRLFTHQGFTTTPAVEAAFAVAGSMAVQGPIIRWVADHRRHHQHSDRPGDPHSPHRGHADHDELSWRGLALGLWYAHVGWFFDAGKASARRYAPDLLANRVVRTVDRHYPLWVGLSLVLPAAITALVRGADAALTGFLVGGLARVFFVQHVTWSVNSVCHTFGRQPFATKDESRNNAVMAILALGEGWHNNHHAFPASSRHGLLRRQFDASWFLIRGLERLGLAHDVRTASADRIRARLRT